MFHETAEPIELKFEGVLGREMSIIELILQSDVLGNDIKLQHNSSTEFGMYIFQKLQRFVSDMSFNFMYKSL